MRVTVTAAVARQLLDQVGHAHVIEAEATILSVVFSKAVGVEGDEVVGEVEIAIVDASLPRAFLTREAALGVLGTADSAVGPVIAEEGPRK